MTFDYGYRDSSNARLTGTIVAPSRDAAYRILKEKGIKPTFVRLAPGFANRLLSLGKRGWSIIALAVFCLILGAVALEVARRARASRAQQQAAAASPLTRRQIYGDPALMEKLQNENYASLFDSEGDRVLAHFAQPAHEDRFIVSVRRDPARRRAAIQALAALADAASHRDPTPASPADALPRNARSRSRETSELARIVLWMRGEFSAYLANGLGTPESYLRRLLERQQYEVNLLTRTRRELEKERDPAVWEKRNDELRAVGAPTLAMPE